MDAKLSGIPGQILLDENNTSKGAEAPKSTISITESMSSQVKDLIQELISIGADAPSLNSLGKGDLASIHLQGQWASAEILTFFKMASGPSVYDVCDNDLQISQKLSNIWKPEVYLDDQMTSFYSP
ncbi:hypothetical protein MG293_011006 [Ovis ammon polii]|uniref:Uncharacterized protein n=1 Tax=Ovis ammon polii TaxID=230172 RepID=A0AAD4U6A0_OVIAM|nr:hypothetical protein MG293_011006 [Ovis ammon polii]